MIIGLYISLIILSKDLLRIQGIKAVNCILVQEIPTTILMPFLKDICQSVNSGYCYSRVNKTSENLEKLLLEDRPTDISYRNVRKKTYCRNSHGNISTFYHCR